MRHNTTNNDFIYGINPINEALDERKTIDKILIKKGKSDEEINTIIAKCKSLNIPFLFVPSEKLDRITRKNHQGCIALSSPIDFHKIEDILPQIFESGELPLIMILDGLTDVRNFGAISRTCLAAGVHTIIIPSKNFARIGPDAVKTSAGALLKLPICREDNLVSTVDFLQQSGVQVVAATEKAENNYYQIDFTRPSAIVMGAEDVGISHDLLRKSEQLVKIPMYNQFDSLNVSVAAGILSFEAVKQRLSDL
jgi:23S rRNA (guanosine2251-2'-O)-methyltransferase